MKIHSDTVPRYVPQYCNSANPILRRSATRLGTQFPGINIRFGFEYGAPAASSVKSISATPTSGHRSKAASAARRIRLATLSTRRAACWQRSSVRIRCMCCSRSACATSRSSALRGARRRAASPRLISCTKAIKPRSHGDRARGGEHAADAVADRDAWHRGFGRGRCRASGARYPAMRTCCTCRNACRRGSRHWCWPAALRADPAPGAVLRWVMKTAASLLASPRKLLPCHGRGRGFKSRRSRHFKIKELAESYGNKIAK